MLAACCNGNHIACTQHLLHAVYDCLALTRNDSPDFLTVVIIDSSFGGGLDCADGCAMLLCSGDSEEPERVREAVLSRAEALLREGIGADYFLRMKRSALGRRIKGLDSFDGTCFRLCAYHFAGFDYFRFPAIYQDITPEEVLAFLARVVKPDRCALSVIDSVAEPAI